ncbi:MAG: hypothetical protein HY540_02275 [Deltaproteobacteria bacterium]|nr:hypothetical protein [Deltaproteobacteria bacterium]
MNVTQRHHAFVSLAVLAGKELSSLEGFLAEDEAQECREAARHFEGLEPAEATEKAKHLLRSLLAMERFSGLAEIHPAWVLTALAEESPRTIGVILRYLPSRHVRYILEHLPETVRQNIPQLLEIFSLPTPLLSIIKRRFEQRFLRLPMSREQGEFAFEHLYLLKPEELQALFFDVGLHEMAMAFSGLSAKTVHTILNRLPLREAKQVRARLDAVQGFPEALLHEARFTVIEASSSKPGVNQFVTEIGLAAFARSLGEGHDLLLKRLMLKLPPVFGYALKRAAEEWKKASDDAVIAFRQQLVLERLRDAGYRDSMIDSRIAA